jgi:hypothetical protein
MESFPQNLAAFERLTSKAMNPNPTIETADFADDADGEN